MNLFERLFSHVPSQKIAGFAPLRRTLLEGGVRREELRLVRDERLGQHVENIFNG